MQQDFLVASFALANMPQGSYEKGSCSLLTKAPNKTSVAHAGFVRGATTHRVNNN